MLLYTIIYYSRLQADYVALCSTTENIEVAMASMASMDGYGNYIVHTTIEHDRVVGPGFADDDVFLFLLSRDYFHCYSESCHLFHVLSLLHFVHASHTTHYLATLSHQ